MKKPVHLFMALGFTSMVSQVLLMRELIVVFYGNELSLGIMLGSWLFWVGLGSFLAAHALPRLAFFQKHAVAAFLQALLGLLSILTLLAVRLLPALSGRGTLGEIVGYFPIAVSSFLAVAPVCLLLGFLFTYFCHLWSDAEAAASISSVYFLEGFGAVAGGVAFAFLFVRVLDPIEIAWALLILNLAAAASLLVLGRASVAAIVAVSSLAVIAAASAPVGLAAKLKAESLAWLWRGLNAVASESSIYGRITFVENDEQKSLYGNGLLMFSYPNRFAAEESVHFALLAHPNPQRVLLIGGGGGGTLGETLKHSVTRVDYLELDPLTIKMVRAHFPPEVQEQLDDPRVRIHHVDGRLFLNENPDVYDVIIVDLPDPYTAQLNRFYTLEFFRMCKRRLSPGGILSLKVTSAENYISSELRQFIGCIYQTLQHVFPDVQVIPGETNIFLAGTDPKPLSIDSDLLIERLSERGIKEKLLFIREYYLPFRLSDERLLALRTALSGESFKINADLEPVCYYYDAVLWSKQFKDFSSAMLSFLSRIPPLFIFVGLGISIAVGVFSQALFPRIWGPRAILVAVGTTGFAEITVEIVTLLGFQAIHGYVYHKIALIVTAFMLGLSIGAVGMGRVVKSYQPKPRLFLIIQAMVFLYPLLLLAALLLMSGGGDAVLKKSDFWQANVLFPLLAFVAGLVGGLQFPLANALWLAEVPGTARAAGFTYGIDLFGSCLGAFLATAFLVPIYGIPFACITAAILNLGAFLLLFCKFSLSR